jgi:diguanylate cyclase (GGDEF)-like protein
VTPLIWVLITIVGFNLLLYFLFRHVSQLEQTSKQELQYQAQHDQLTGLPNLRYIEQYFQQWKSQNGNAYSVVFLDLDNFKNSNDLHGHAVGDRLLQKVAKRIQLFFNECLCLRQGGDEFIVIVPRNYCSDIERKVEEFLLDLKKTIFINKLEFSIRASIGISSSPKDGLEIDSLLRKADIAMYEAKRHKTGWHVFSRKLDVDNSRKSMIEKELNSALERKEMSVVYQPQVDNHDKLIGVEALLRWNNKLLGQVPPDEFIAIAESTGMILDIGNFVFETSLKEFHHVCKRLFSDSWVDEESKLRLSINLSVRQLIEEGFTDRLFSLINQYDCKNTRLMLEITETMTIDRVQEVRFLLEKIQRAGIEISLDDFGTGYSSLSHLSQLPINEIKIDKSFIHSSLQNIQDVTFIKSIIYLGNKLDVKVLAEGVETSEQVVALKQYGCKYFQGFYFSHPLNIQQLQDYIGKTECQTS